MYSMQSAAVLTSPTARQHNTIRSRWPSTPLVRFVACLFAHTLARARSPRETKWTYDNERGGFTITTLHRILGGAQVYDSYGQKCNHRFLLNYGFAIENNQEANGFCPNEVRRNAAKCGGIRYECREMRGARAARLVALCSGHAGFGTVLRTWVYHPSLCAVTAVPRTGWLGGVK